MRRLFLFFVVFILLLGNISAAKNLVKVDLSVEGNKRTYYLNQTPVQNVEWTVKVERFDNSVRYVDVNLVRIKVGDLNKFYYTHPSFSLPKVMTLSFRSDTESVASRNYNTPISGDLGIDYMYQVKEPFFEQGAYYYYASIVGIRDSSNNYLIDEVISDNSDNFPIVVLNKKAVVSETNYLLVFLVSLLAIGILLKSEHRIF